MWLVDNEKNLAMSCLPKNGHTSLCAHFKSKQVHHADVLDIPQRIVWIRNTMLRLTSNYSMWKSLGENGQVNKGNQPVLDNCESWEQFIDFVLDSEHSRDNHWDGQVPQLTHNGIYLGTVTYRMENWHKLWGQFYRGVIPFINGIVHEEINEAYRIDEINTVYKADIDLWNVS